MKLCEINDGNFITYDSKTSTFDYADKYKCSLNTRDGYFSSKPSENKTFLRMNDDRRLDFISLNDLYESRLMLFSFPAWLGVHWCWHFQQ